MPPAAKLLHPSTLILIAANALPLLGVVFWQWDTFLLLVLYWMETAIIGFWTLLLVALLPHDIVGPTARQTSRWFLVPFFIVHSGIFMSVHFMFLWAMFAGPWPARVGGPVSFLRIVVIESGLWVPLVALFVARGVSSLFGAFGKALLPAWLVPDSGTAAAKPKDDNPFSDKRLLGGFYIRIVVMHLAILFGAFVAVVFGNIGPLVLMVALKTAIDLRLHLAEDLQPIRHEEARLP